MRKLIQLSISLLFAVSAFSQTALVQTTLSSAITSSRTTIQVASATGITQNTYLLVDKEVMAVQVTPTNTYISVVRGINGTAGNGHKSGSAVLIGNPTAFLSYDPSGTCTNGQGLFVYSPVVNTRTGNEWLCSTVTGKVVPGFQNDYNAPSVTTAVASAAAQVTPTGPLFHITGALAITGFNIPVGFDPTSGGGFCAIADGAYTTTTANNIGATSTGVVGKTICWSYDPNSTKFYPSN